MKSNVAFNSICRARSLKNRQAPFSTPISTTDSPAKSRVICWPIRATAAAISSRLRRISICVETRIFSQSRHEALAEVLLVRLGDHAKRVVSFFNTEERSKRRTWVSVWLFVRGRDFSLCHRTSAPLPPFPPFLCVERFFYPSQNKKGARSPKLRTTCA